MFKGEKGMRKVTRIKATAIAAILTATALMTGCGNIHPENVIAVMKTVSEEQAEKSETDTDQDEKETKKDKDNSETQKEDDEEMYDDKAARHVEPGILATVRHSNWGMTYEDYWDSTDFTVYYDQTIERTEYYVVGGKDVKYTAKDYISADDFEDLEKNLQKVRPKHSSSEGADGDAWAIQVYDEEGKLTNSMPAGYVYGVNLLEKKICPVLEKYAQIEIPDEEEEEDESEIAQIQSDNNNVRFSIISSFVDQQSASQYGSARCIFTVRHDGSVYAQVFDPNNGEEDLDFQLTEEQYHNLNVYIDAIIKAGESVVDMTQTDFYQYDICDEDENIVMSTITDGTNSNVVNAYYVLIDAYMAAWMEAQGY